MEIIQVYDIDMRCLICIALAFVGLSFQDVEDDEVKNIVIDSFVATHDGYSCDEVILNPELNRKFLDKCKESLPQVKPLDFNWKLINLRKAGKLSHIKTTVRRTEDTSKYQILAEVVSRTILDQAKVSIDRIMADPHWSEKFDQAAKRLDSEANIYLVRKAAFKLRKTRKLRPELITRIADWNREIATMTVSEYKHDEERVPESPGIYIFHNESGYLYIGHSDDLRQRLNTHLNDSSNKALASFLQQSDDRKTYIEIHSFPIESRMKEIAIRRAYESELIRSRKPKFNILP